MKDVQIRADGPTYYFGDTNAKGTSDFAAGSDKYSCASIEYPCTSWAKARAIGMFANIILDGGDAEWLATANALARPIGPVCGQP